MKKLVFIAIVGCVVLMMGSCNSKTEKVPFDNGDSVTVGSVDSTIYGVCGEETAMNTLQLITDMGDTLTLDISEAQEKGQVFGGLQVGDRMAALPNSDYTAAKMVINQATLLGNWVMPNPLDGSDEVGVRIKEGGIAESIEQSNIIYKTWKLVKGQLEFVLVREGGSEEDEVNYFNIIKLDADSLFLRQVLRLEDIQSGLRDDMEELRYNRQKPKEEYGKDVKLEDSDSEFFL